MDAVDDAFDTATARTFAARTAGARVAATRLTTAITATKTPSLLRG
jgi:hypothetical protein